MNSSDIRRRFLSFFADHGHTVVKSSSLIPAEDPTLLFTNAGMNQFKDVFLGREERPYRTAATCQKCVRAGGKHNDLDTVGRTRRHHTFFEMLGNFSFGAYFKNEAIDYAWTLLTKEFGLSPKRLWVTVFNEDQEAENIWATQIGVPRDRIVRMDEKDNFWQMGDVGPCGPCSEIHYDLGPEASEAGHANCVFPCECGRYVEIWNLVFMQFNRDKSGALAPLPRPSIDTGMGLERLAAVLQGKLSNFDTDLLRPIIDHAAEILGVTYGAASKSDTSLRVIADHVRATTFLIGDGVIPSNEGRGYVLRKIMRRGIRQGSLLGFKGPFLDSLSGFVVERMQDVYPELATTRDYIARVIRAEEDRFASMATTGVERLTQVMADLTKAGKDTVPGVEIFKLYDTFGFPLDFTTELADERGMKLDLAGFEIELEKQRERARQSWKGGEDTARPEFKKLLDSGGTTFLGYEAVEAAGRVRAIYKDGAPVESVEGAGQTAEIVLDHTPFYAESGGQVGDTGSMTGPRGAARVVDTYAPVRGVIVHKVRMEFGALGAGEEVKAVVDAERRRRIAANHTGTHLLHAALRATVGPHVKQAGSLVAPDRMRFDYTHFAPLTPREIQEIEERINRIVFSNMRVETDVLGLEEAISRGALAFFGEKYAQQVRVVAISGVSMELCGGTHTHMTGDVGLFKIVGETSVAAGVRRIEAVTGFGAYSRLEEDEEMLRGVSQILRSPRQEITGAIERLLERQRQLENELEAAKRKSATGLLDGILAGRNSVKDVSVVASRVDDVEGPVLRELAETTAARLGSGVVVLGSAAQGKVSLVSVVSPDLQRRFHAGKIVKEVALLVGGSGGGRPDFAQAGGKDAGKLDEALQAVYNIVAGIAS
ncbi:MAG TPA: alanine--tRNA ligase [Terriglobia bacterium]|nr:alanine--tRNA ligase [Terriglobia bacterium]